jgi:hypothetical protein
MAKNRANEVATGFCANFCPPVSRKSYRGTDFVSVKDTGFPVSDTQSVNGSPPNCSAVAPCWSVTVPGKVTGMGTEHVLRFAATVTPVIAFALLSTCQVRVGLQLSLAILERNPAAT